MLPLFTRLLTCVGMSLALSGGQGIASARVRKPVQHARPGVHPAAACGLSSGRATGVAGAWAVCWHDFRSCLRRRDGDTCAVGDDLSGTRVAVHAVCSEAQNLQLLSAGLTLRALRAVCMHSSDSLRTRGEVLWPLCVACRAQPVLLRSACVVEWGCAMQQCSTASANDHGRTECMRQSHLAGGVQHIMGCAALIRSGSGCQRVCLAATLRPLLHQRCCMRGAAVLSCSMLELKYRQDCCYPGLSHSSASASLSTYLLFLEAKVFGSHAPTGARTAQEGSVCFLVGEMMCLPSTLATLQSMVTSSS